MVFYTLDVHTCPDSLRAYAWMTQTGLALSHLPKQLPFLGEQELNSALLV